MNNLLEKLSIFNSIAETQSFTKTAENLGLNRSTISQHLQNLESNLGVKLVNRNTRHVSLTQAGKSLYQGGLQLLHDCENLIQSIQNHKNSLNGTIRIGMQSDIGVIEIIPHIVAFQKTHPDIIVETFLTDSVNDLVEHNFDMTFRISVVGRSNNWGELYSVALKEIPASVCASPRYFNNKAKPKTLSELAKCNWVIPSMLPTPYDWELIDKKGNKHKIHVQGNLKVNSARGLYSALSSGAGVSVVLNDFAEQEIKEGKLVKVLPEYTVVPRQLYLVYTEKEFMSARNRVFVDFIKKTYLT